MSDVPGYAKPHVWNLVAKVLRENPVTDDDSDACDEVYERICFAFAERFEQDEGFDRIEFLKGCGL